MTAAARQRVGFKIMPFSNDPNARPAFYADVIGVNTTVHERGTRTLAVQLANVMASTATMVKSIGPSQSLPPQYLMATRPSVFSTLGQQYPLYTQLYSLTTSTNPVMFKLNENSRTWLESMKGAIKTEMLSNPTCGCDYPALQTIASNNAAPAICNATCSAHGGWSGQWTNEYPAAQSGSVCGCNSCPAQPDSQISLQSTSSKKIKGDPR
jgi:thiamine pyridinylase